MDELQKLLTLILSVGKWSKYIKVLARDLWVNALQLVFIFLARLFEFNLSLLLYLSEWWAILRRLLVLCGKLYYLSCVSILLLVCRHIWSGPCFGDLPGVYNFRLDDILLWGLFTLSSYVLLKSMLEVACVSLEATSGRDKVHAPLLLCGLSAGGLLSLHHYIFKSLIITKCILIAHLP